jgi:RimJ/RimL family protein N-acetyltransferase
MKNTVFLNQYYQQKSERVTLHVFPNLDDSERLCFEKLHDKNFSILVDLFSNDTSPFIDKRFKNLTEAKKYCTEILNSLYSGKYGGCDFLIKEKNTGLYLGVLHLFDYSLETYSDVPDRCTIGFAIAKEFRRKYYATEAVNHLIKYAQLNHKKSKFLAYTHIENIPANHFLVSLNMVLSNEDYYYGGRTSNYYVLKMPN